MRVHYEEMTESTMYIQNRNDLCIIDPLIVLVCIHLLRCECNVRYTTFPFLTIKV